MNNKVITGIVILVIVIIAFLFISSKGTQQPSPAPSQAQTQTTSPSQTTQSQNTITLTQNGFSPATLTIKAGTTVKWINKSGSEAAVYSNPHPIHTDYPPLNLGGFSDGGTLSLTFNKAGTYGYHNHLNPSQTGTIVVQ